MYFLLMQNEHRKQFVEGFIIITNSSTSLVVRVLADIFTRGNINDFLI